MHEAEHASLKPLVHASHVSLAPRLNVLTGHDSVPVRSAFGLLPAVATEQYTAAVLEEYWPGPLHDSHVVPVSENVPATQSMHSLVSSSVRVPGAQTVHEAEPASLKPLVHASHVSLAPRLNVLTGHGSVPVRSALGLLPAVATEQ